MKDYRRLSGEDVWAFMQSQDAAALAAEQQAWERDHPGEQFPEHQSGLSDREATDYARWQRQREKRPQSKPPTDNERVN